VWDINTLTYKMSSSSSSKPIRKKRKLSKFRSGPNPEREQQISDFLDRGIDPAESTWKRTKTGRLYTYHAMATSEERSAEPPPADEPEETWAGDGWTLKVESGRNGALKFPVGSKRIDAADLLGMPPLEKERCVPAEKPATYRRTSRNWVDKVEKDGTIHENYYLASAMRWAKKGETPNCRLMLDPDNPEECVIMSICKTQSNTEWKLDQDYAHRMIAMGDYEPGQHPSSDEESEISELAPAKEVARARRSVTNAEKLDREEDTAAYQAQVLSYLEGAARDRAACLAGLENTRGILEGFIHGVQQQQERSLNLDTRQVFDLLRLVSLGKAICQHFDIPLEAGLFTVVPDGEETKENQ